MGLDSFIPTIWSARIQMRLQKALVYGQADVANRYFEGELRKQGDTVRIGGIGPVTIKSHTKDTDIDTPETLQDASQFLVVDQGDYFNFAVDDVDKVQANPTLIDQAARDAAYGMADTADQYIAGLSWQSVPAAATQGAVGTGLDVGYGTGETSPYLALVTMGRHLDEANVPREGRWVIVPPWFHAYLLMDTRFIGTGSLPAEQRLGNALVGRVAGFDVRMSNNVPYATATTEFKIVAGIGGAISYVEQIIETEAYRPERRFADAIKGLHIYGAKVVRPEMLALCIADIGTAES